METGNWERKNAGAEAHQSQASTLTLKGGGEGGINAFLTCFVRRLEASLLHRVVREKTQEHSVARGDDRGRLFGAAEASQAGGARAPPVVDLQVVVGAFQVSFHVHLVENLQVRENVCCRRDVFIHA